MARPTSNRRQWNIYLSDIEQDMLAAITEHYQLGAKSDAARLAIKRLYRRVVRERSEDGNLKLTIVSPPRGRPRGKSHVARISRIVKTVKSAKRQIARRSATG